MKIIATFAVAFFVIGCGGEFDDVPTDDQQQMTQQARGGNGGGGGGEPADCCAPDPYAEISEVSCGSWCMCTYSKKRDVDNCLSECLFYPTACY